MKKFHPFILPQLDETNAVLQAEQEAAARMKKSQTELQKHIQSLEASLGEVKERCSQLEKDRMELEKQLMVLQAELDEERRDQNLRTETIADLQGELQVIKMLYEKSETGKINIKLTLLLMSLKNQIFRSIQSFYCSRMTAVLLWLIVETFEIHR